jgi:uncharacterized protein
MMGRGVEKNGSEAIRLLNVAANAGDADALFQLGVCYEDGIGVPQNHSEALPKCFSRT